ncbi:MAG TPA: hypothetical protein PLR76_03245 [Hyphomonas sp.]|nr:hypothetical protein [Hyphomonas sp.]MCA8903456.1 hypothetical protein [Hyphomonas sp.]HPE47378.1 hypothetical protein [Hyphomonas sp.]
MQKLVAAGIVLSAVGAIAITGAKQEMRNRQEIIAQFNLNDMEVHTMQVCEGSMSTNNVKFRSGVSQISGCGCFAREIADRIDAPHWSDAMALMMIAHANIDDKATSDQLFAKVADFQSTRSLSDYEMNSLLENVLAGFQRCAKRETYMSEEQLTAKAAAKDEFMRKQERAFDYAVTSGHMTREEADARLARLKQK